MATFPKTRSVEIMGIKLTNEEVILIFSKPEFAKKSAIAATEAGALAPTIFPEPNLDRPQWQTKADAFRLTYWNVLMSKRCSPGWAEAFATAHESESPNGDDKMMDLSNNAAGRRIYLTNPNASDLEYIAQVTYSEYQHIEVNVTFNSARLVYIRPKGDEWTDFSGDWQYINPFFPGPSHTMSIHQDGTRIWGTYKQHTYQMPGFGGWTETLSGSANGKNMYVEGIITALEGSTDSLYIGQVMQHRFYMDGDKLIEESHIPPLSFTRVLSKPPAP